MAARFNLKYMNLAFFSVNQIISLKFVFTKAKQASQNKIFYEFNKLRVQQNLEQNVFQTKRNNNIGGTSAELFNKKANVECI